jgi:hypothetical protein
MDVFTEETKTIERIASAREFLCKPLHQHIYRENTASSSDHRRMQGISVVSCSCLKKVRLTKSSQVPMYSLPPRYIEQGSPVVCQQQVRSLPTLHLTGAGVL